ncbi:probable bifunctional dTTP/UTP pyrophosphatase/methyltransferase protein [Ptychodera flava]|uniref:probable bifunctional dTTP/UTP pyrophosphatase/methyltransferase protein n=1 Tax=Ptychodera flava TaxID=63121 RepID=UPI003969BFD9
MANQSNDPVQILSHIHSYAVTQSLVAACHLRLFDQLENEGVTAKQVADAVHSDFDGVRGLLNALVSMGYVQKMGDNTSTLYKNTPLASNFLVTTSAQSLYPYVMIQGQVSYPVQSNYKYAVQEGRPQVQRTFNQGTYFSDIITKDSKKAMGFFASMHSIARVFHCPVVLDNFNFSQYREACDLGSGSGTIGLALSQTYKDSMTVTIYDSPMAIEASMKFMPESSFPGNLTFTKGDMMRDSLPYCNLYVLSHVINMLSDERAAFLLKKVFATMVPGGAILLLETLLNDDMRGPQLAHMLSMGLLAFNGTRQRSGEEVQKLLEGQGFREVQVTRTGTLSDAILATKPLMP